MATEKPLATGETSQIPQTEGFAPFKHPFFSTEKGDPAEIKTWYRIYGDLEPGVSRPLFILHGGPAVHSPGLSPALEDFILPKLLPANRPLVLYDQIGCGRTTHLDNRKGDKKFWVPELFIAELDNLTKHLGVRDAEPGFDVFGHSWGAQVSSRYAVWVSTQPVETAPKLHRVVLSSPTCRWKDMWRARDIGLAQLPEKMQEDVKKGIAEGKTDSPEYMAAVMQFLSNGLMRNAPPEYQERTKMTVRQLKDNVPFQVIFGTDPLNPNGTLNDFGDMSEECKKIKQPVLLLNGEFDNTRDFSVQPYFNGIPKVKWCTISGASHSAQMEKPEKFGELVVEFLSN